MIRRRRRTDQPDRSGWSWKRFRFEVLLLLDSPDRGWEEILRRRCR